MPKIAIKGGTRRRESTTSSNRGSRQIGEILKTPASASSAAFVLAPAEVFALRPMMRKNASATRKAGTTVLAMPRMCWSTVTPPTIDGTRIVVSESGDILSPR